MLLSAATFGLQQPERCSRNQGLKLERNSVSSHNEPVIETGFFSRRLTIVRKHIFLHLSCFYFIITWFSYLNALEHSTDVIWGWQSFWEV